MWRAACVCVLAGALSAMGCDLSEDEGQCAESWWVFEEAGSVALKGRHAVVSPAGGLTNADFANYEANAQCVGLSMGAFATGRHENLTCVVNTAQGGNPQWSAALDPQTGIDHRPVLTILDQQGDYYIGMYEGQIDRLDTISVSPPDIRQTVSNFRFVFKALNASAPERYSAGACSTGVGDDDYERCEDDCYSKYSSDAAQCNDKDTEYEKSKCHRDAFSEYLSCKDRCKQEV